MKINENVFLLRSYGSSKTAIVLIKKFNFKEHGKKVLLVKPAIDIRDGEKVLKSRVGLENEMIVLNIGESFQEKVQDLCTYDIIIMDESQFFTEHQIDELRFLADRKFMVMCYGGLKLTLKIGFSRGAEAFRIS